MQILTIQAEINQCKLLSNKSKHMNSVFERI